MISHPVSSEEESLKDMRVCLEVYVGVFFFSCFLVATTQDVSTFHHV